MMCYAQVVQEHMPEHAVTVFEKCINERALVLSGDATSASSSRHGGDAPSRTSAKPNCLLVEPDFQLISALMDSQQNFTVSDPSLPDNPIVYASQGFLNLTGYTLDKVSSSAATVCIHTMASLCQHVSMCSYAALLICNSTLLNVLWLVLFGLLQTFHTAEQAVSMFISVSLAYCVTAYTARLYVYIE
jgi:hypothetical protein